MAATDTSKGQTPEPTIRFKCVCGKGYSTAAVNAGRVIGCKSCGRQIKIPKPAARGTGAEPAKWEAPDMRMAETKATGDVYPHFADWDRSPDACQTRADALRATIPPAVAEQVRGHFVSEAGFSVDTFSGHTWKPAVRCDLDAIMLHLANSSPFGILNAFLRFDNGMTITFKADSFAGFTTKAEPTRRQSDEEEEDK